MLILKQIFFELILKRKFHITSYQNERFSFCINEVQVLTTCTFLGMLIQFRFRRLIGWGRQYRVFDLRLNTRGRLQEPNDLIRFYFGNRSA